MNKTTFEQWLRAYGSAWESRSPEMAIKLFAEDVTYQATPFLPPIQGRRELLKYWSHVASTQEDVHFKHEILGIGKKQSIAHWRARFLRTLEKKEVQLDGICVVSFDAEGRCQVFKEWWHKREQTLPAHEGRKTRRESAECFTLSGHCLLSKKRRLWPIQIQGCARNGSAIFPVCNDGSLVSVQLTNIAYLRHEIGAILVLPPMAAISSQRFYQLRSIRFDIHGFCSHALLIIVPIQNI